MSVEWGQWILGLASAPLSENKGVEWEKACKCLYVVGGFWVKFD